MKTKLSLMLGSFACICLTIMSACNSDKLPEPKPADVCETVDATYDGQVKEIINTSCALSGCHVSGGDGPGDYTSYTGLEGWLTDSGIREYVVVLRNDPINGMPPNWDENPGPQDLTEEQFQIMKCWIDAGYPEN